MDEALPDGVHLVGSVPLGSAEEVFRRVAEVLGDRVRRMPDGETGARSDWIVWQYPLFSSRPQFEIGPPGASSYRALPQLRLRTGEDADGMAFEELGYASAAIESYRTFSRLKRDGVVPPGCRFLVSLPTPLAPVSAFVALEYQAELEPVYEAQMHKEVEHILAAIPADQLAIQWDARYEFAMLEGAIAVWFEDAQAGIVERLARLAALVPAEIELGFHLCYGDDEHGHFAEPEDAGRLVGVANALAATLDRPLNWIHMPVPEERDDDAYYAPLGELTLPAETELFLGLIHAADRDDGALRRIAAARRHVADFGVATECGWGRGGAAAVTGLLALHRGLTSPLPDDGGPAAGAHFSWPAGFEPIPGEDWMNRDVDEAGIAYDHVDAHGWYRNLDVTVEELVGTLRDGDVLLDYSGGTGILLDRLRLRVFDRQVGVVIVDASAKFLRIALEKYQGDPLVALRLLRYLKDEQRLQTLDEVLDLEFDALACTNAIHLYPDLGETLGAWMRALRPGGGVFVNSGNIRNPRAKPAEWILDETVWVINDLAEGLVRSDPQYVHYREDVDDAARMKAHADHRNRVFLQPRPLDSYVDALGEAGFEVLGVREETIEARVSEWFEFLSAYHDAVLGWVGGTQRIDGAEPTPGAVRDRLKLIRHAMETLFGGRPTFNACWTYITARKPPDGPAAPPPP
jgi:ubiquinone/menaquinone biosynthesis C-methylase UbiE